MSRATLILNTQADRDKASKWAQGLPFGTRVEFKSMVRSQEQNAWMWVLLTELSTKLKWHGMKLTAEDYKDLLTAAMRKEIRQVPNTEGTGFVILGMRTSDMTVPEMSDLIELIYAFGAQNGIQLPEPVKGLIKPAANASSPDVRGVAKEGPPSDGSAAPPDRPEVALAADLKHANDATVLAWADVLEGKLRGARTFEIDVYWRAASEAGRLAILARVSSDRYRALNQLSSDLRAGRAA